MDPDNYPGTPLTFNWIQVSGPATAVFSDVFALAPNIVAPLPGTYIFKLTASDGITPTSATLTVPVLPYYSSTQTYAAVCPSGAIGSSVIQSATYTSITSQADADSKALNAATIAASAALVCTSAPAQFTLRTASALASNESLKYNLYVLNAGTSSDPVNAIRLNQYPISNSGVVPNTTIDYTSIATSFTGEQTFLWTYDYSAKFASGSVNRTYAVNVSTLQVDPSFINVNTLYGYQLPVTGSGALVSNAVFIDAPNVLQSRVALAHNFVSPSKSRLWIYNWDGRKADSTVTPFDTLKISYLSSGTPSVPITETTLFEEDFSSFSYGLNLTDFDNNYFALDTYVGALASGGGTLIVRRGNIDPTTGEIVYAADSTVLSANALANSGSASVINLSGNQSILENISGALSLSSNSTIVSARIRTGCFAINANNWRTNSNSNYTYLVVKKLIGPVGAFTGVSNQYAFQMPSPTSPTLFFEVPLPSNANGVSYAIYAATSAGGGNYSLFADSFAVSPTNFVDIHKDSTTAPYTVSSLTTNQVGGLPSALNGVFTITDDNRSVIISRAG